MTIRYQHKIHRDDLRRNRDTLFVFGDNMMRSGYGGQAAAMRGEPNAVGIPTKHEPHNGSTAFFTDQDLASVKPAIDKAFLRLTRHLENGGTVVWPSDGIGSGRADLARRAPRIRAYIDRCFERMATYDQEPSFSR